MRRARRCQLLALGRLMDLQVSGDNTWGFSELGLLWEGPEAGCLLLEGVTEGRVSLGVGPAGERGLWVQGDASLGWLSASGLFEEMVLPGDGWRCGGPHAIGPGPFRRIALHFREAPSIDAPEGALEGEVWPWPDDGGITWNDGPTLFRRHRGGPTRTLVGLRRTPRSVGVGPKGACWCEVDGESFGAAPLGPLRKLPEGLDLGTARFSPCGEVLVVSREEACLLISLRSGSFEVLGEGEPVGWREGPVWRDGERLLEGTQVLREDLSGWPAMLAHGHLLGPGNAAWNLNGGHRVSKLPKLDGENRQIVQLPFGFCLGAGRELVWLDLNLQPRGHAQLPPGQRLLDLRWDSEEQAVFGLSARGPFRVEPDGSLRPSSKVALFGGPLSSLPKSHTIEGGLTGRQWLWDDCGLLVAVEPQVGDPMGDPA
jgi:hypothetical protein